MFIQLEECHTSNGPTCCEWANLKALNPNLLAASNLPNGRLKAKSGSKPGNNKKAHPANSSGDGKPIVCVGCNKPRHKKSECPERKGGIQPMLVQLEEEMWQWLSKKLFTQAWLNLLVMPMLLVNMPESKKILIMTASHTTIALSV